MHLGPDISDPAAPAISFDQFLAVDIRIGTIVKAETFPEARRPAYKLSIDFGPTLGTKRSSAQITAHYTAEELVGRQVAAVVNFPPRQIGKLMSRCSLSGFRIRTAQSSSSRPTGPCQTAHASSESG